VVSEVKQMASNASAVVPMHLKKVSVKKKLIYKLKLGLINV